MPKAIDLSGRVFGGLTVIRFAGRESRRRMWECLCVCGKKKTFPTCTISTGKTKSCGCLNAPDLSGFEVGQKFGLWEIIEDPKSVRDSKGLARIRVKIRCECGLEKLGYVATIRSGKSRACDSCATKKAWANEVGGITATRTHGMAGTPLFNIWCGMKRRCGNSTDGAYASYGGRGIYVCDRWKGSFENFLEDMGDRPEGMSIDRIDNNKGYSKENCRWATRKEQAQNRRSSRLIAFRGVEKPLIEWARDVGICSHSLSRRLDRWPIEKALTLPRYGRA